MEFLNKFFELSKRCCFGLQAAVKEITLKRSRTRSGAKSTTVD